LVGKTPSTRRKTPTCHKSLKTTNSISYWSLRCDQWWPFATQKFSPCSIYMFTAWNVVYVLSCEMFC
jgi:hypothetical protein